MKKMMFMLVVLSVMATGTVLANERGPKRGNTKVELIVFKDINHGANCHSNAFAHCPADRGYKSAHCKSCCDGWHKRDKRDKRGCPHDFKHPHKKPHHVCGAPAHCHDKGGRRAPGRR